MILGGYGFGNTGDEAQLGANLTRWRAVTPPVEPVVASPHPDYTTGHHGVRSVTASRALFFRSTETSDYNLSNAWFRVSFWPALIRMELNARLMAAGLAPPLASAAEARFLTALQSASVVHVSGGGFMTGPTRSRLWDTCLILRLCRRLGTPYFLTGQTLGIFQNQADRWLAKTALSGAIGVSLRDPADSATEVKALGLPGVRIEAGFDDALFCDAASDETIDGVLVGSGLAPGQAFLAVNYHWWGMDADTRETSARRLAQTLDTLGRRLDAPVLFVPMVPADEEAQRNAMERMQHDAALLSYDYDYRTVRSVIARARALLSFKHHPLIFALGERTPCLSISFDPYYHRKNIGALANFGLERFCVDREGFFGEGLESRFDDLIAESDSLRTDLADSLAAARSAQDAFFDDCLRAAGLSDP
ncbi:MAG: polysaccharide pyruvyl transferase family protein [Rhodobacter sp.]|nr:polysaccharide pyruvyl transferase family protein [Rhodobacter sp.]